MNPGPWVSHSKNVARAAERIAGRIEAIDTDRAFVSGLLHDIGRRNGRTQNRHLIDGYRYLTEAGHSVLARVCITHAFPLQDPRALFGSWEYTTAEERQFVEDYVRECQYDDYDRLMQLCDHLAVAEGFVILEKRMVDVAIRYGVIDLTVQKWKAAMSLKERFDGLAGINIYSLLPGIAETTLQ
jgi:putative nucleotidyltransferase with HDIG domain